MMFAHAQYRWLLLFPILLQCWEVCIAGNKHPYYHKGEDGLYYKYHSTKKHWEGASKHCEDEGAHLAIIHTEKTVNYVKDTFRYLVDGIWVGARWRDSKKAWHWEDDTAVPVKSWDDGQPAWNPNPVVIKPTKPTTPGVVNGTTGTKEEEKEDGDDDEEEEEDKLPEKCVMTNFGNTEGHLFSSQCKMEMSFLCQKEHRSCVYDPAPCVSSNGSALPSKVLIEDLKDLPVTKCLDACLDHPGVTGCWAIEVVPSAKTPVKDKSEDEEDEEDAREEENTSTNHMSNNSTMTNSTMTNSTMAGGSKEEKKEEEMKKKEEEKEKVKKEEKKEEKVGGGAAKQVCYVTTHPDVSKGPDTALGDCWVISKCEGTGSLPPPPPEIPSGYIDHEDFAEYKFYAKLETYDMAKLKCHEDGATLALDNSERDHDFLLNNFPGQTYWIGINDLEQEGIWRYEDSTEIKPKNLRWDSNRPSGHKCAYMWHNGRWRDANCNTKKSFMCEKQGQFVEDAIKGDGGSVLLPVIIVGVLLALLVVGGVVYATVFRKNRGEDYESDPKDPTAGISNAGMSGGEGGATDPVRPGLGRGGQSNVPMDGGDDEASSYYNESAEVRDEPMVTYRPTADEASIEEGGTKRKKKDED